MGTRSLPLISFPPPAPPRPSVNPKFSAYRIPNFSSDFPRSSPNSGAGGAPRALWESEASPTRRKRFGSSSDFDFAEEFDSRPGVRSREKRSRWWFDEDDDVDDDEDDDDSDGLFGLWEDPRTTDFVLKVLGTFGWIIPNIVMSSMMDTGFKGQDAIIMALMLPLGQVAISVVLDKIQGSSGNRKTRRKRKPFSRARRRTRPGNKTQKRNYQTYQPFAEAGSSSFSKNCSKSSSNFGGWDELDQQVGRFSDFHGSPQRKDESLEKVRNVEIEEPK